MAIVLINLPLCISILLVFSILGFHIVTIVININTFGTYLNKIESVFT